ncbi:uncharacterized protein LOC115623003 isoform X6 [Scaptodrosophila lebanonensis]|uniref:Uncharacterized protein LOC115623003 isoform X6 n=1 Tax=Drosophila lebanonensis TaxID=7225 RepID=A0A6J2TD30_DROLE|nr:uncharacterized protein LOC115623003 isoform X6 [Scaptodrosophila lebanonensis]
METFKRFNILILLALTVSGSAVKIEQSDNSKHEIIYNPSSSLVVETKRNGEQTLTNPLIKKIKHLSSPARVLNVTSEALNSTEDPQPTEDSSTEIPDVTSSGPSESTEDPQPTEDSTTEVPDSTSSGPSESTEDPQPTEDSTTEIPDSTSSEPEETDVTSKAPGSTEDPQPTEDSTTEVPDSTSSEPEETDVTSDAPDSTEDPQPTEDSTTEVPDSTSSEPEETDVTSEAPGSTEDPQPTQDSTTEVPDSTSSEPEETDVTSEAPDSTEDPQPTENSTTEIPDVTSSGPSESTEDPQPTEDSTTEIPDSTSSEPPKTSTSAPLSCSSGADFLPNPTDCHRYIRCSHGIEYDMECPPNLWWDYKEFVCSYNESACYNNVDVIDPNEVSCQNGADFIQHPTDCTMYIQCNHGKPLIRYCPVPLYWNPVHKLCGWSNEYCENSNMNHIECREGQLYEIYEPNCSKYIKCFGNQGIVMSCDAGRYWNPVTQSCVKSNKYCKFSRTIL